MPHALTAKLVDQSSSETTVATTTGAKQRLIDSAASLFHSYSYGSVGVQDICEAADVRRGSFYYYFSSKLDLGIAALDKSWHDLKREVFDPAFSDGSPPLDQFRTCVHRLAEYHHRLRGRLGSTVGCPITNLGEELATTEPAIREKADSLLDEMAVYFEAALTRAVQGGDLPEIDTRAGARRILAFIEGALLLAKMGDDPELITSLGLDAKTLVAPTVD